MPAIVTHYVTMAGFGDCASPPDPFEGRVVRAVRLDAVRPQPLLPIESRLHARVCRKSRPLRTLAAHRLR